MCLLFLYAVHRCVFVFRARDATDAAASALRLQLSWWDVLKAVLLATAIAYPILTVLAIAVRWVRSVAALCQQILPVGLDKVHSFTARLAHLISIWLYMPSEMLASILQYVSHQPTM